MPLISNIVFTKNRPLQLHAYLESLRRFFPAGAIQTYILYKPQLFDQEYESCFRSFPDCRVIRETNFHLDFLRLFKSITGKYILFGIDDLVYFDDISFDCIEKAFQCLGDRLFGFSLRLDLRQMPDEVAAGNVQNEVIGEQTICTVNWTKAQNPAAGYPFELCATIYRTQDIRRLLDKTVSPNRFANRFLRPGSAISGFYGKIFKVRKLYKRFGFFYNPNTLESWCCRYVQRHAESFGPLLAWRKICASAIQVNCVNTTTVNEWDDDKNLTVQRLNDKYKEGMRLDIDFIRKNPPQTTHMDHNSFRLVSSRQNLDQERANV